MTAEQKARDLLCRMDYAKAMLEEIEKASFGTLRTGSPTGTTTCGLPDKPLTYDAIKEAEERIKSLMAKRPFSPGMKVYTNPFLTKQFRFPRSKGKRIRQKWAKRPENFRPSRDCLIDKQRGAIYCHPVIADELERALQRGVCL